jgi:two-component system sensor histidine kinase PhoQ
MQGMVDHQLARIARVTQIDGAAEQPWIAVYDVIAQLARALGVAYPEHRIEVESGSEHRRTDWKLRMHEDDLLDVLGNVMENACKYGAGHLRVSLVGEQGKLVVAVEDNGPGIDPQYFPQLLSRGMRLDTQVQGQGIGLAMVAELLAVYGGAVELAPSALGGANIRLLFTAAQKERAEPN